MTYETDRLKRLETKVNDLERQVREMTRTTPVNREEICRDLMYGRGQSYDQRLDPETERGQGAAA